MFIDQPSPTLSRRRLLQGSATLAAARGTLGLLGALATRNALAATGKQLVPAASPYGPLAPVVDGSTGLPLLQLPEGFEYKSYGWTGDPLLWNRPTPGSHDGMAVVGSWRGGSELILVRNHERGLVATEDVVVPALRRYDTGLIDGIVRVPSGSAMVRIGASGTVTDPSAPDPTPFSGYAGGGTSNLLFHGNTWRTSYASLGGTLVNCAGGPTPWGSWLSCEETVLDLSSIGGKKHGYVFEVSASPWHTSAEPIVEMGRFVHEAVAVDLRTGHVYETEDSRNLSAFYRFKPDARRSGLGSLHQGGTLQAARIASIVKQARPSTLAQANDTGLLNPDIGDEYVLEWVDIADPDASPVVVTAQPGGVNFGIMSGPTFAALSKGCARMSRGEGIWYSAGRMFVVDTAAGLDASGRPGRGEGCVWELDLRTQRLRCVFASGDSLAANNPDNVTVSPRGGVLLCEDGGTGKAGAARLLGLDATGEAYEFCRNNVVLDAGQVAAAGKTVAPGNYLGSEFCGACFDPKGLVLFVNIQTPGITFAIKGPWKRGNL